MASGGEREAEQPAPELPPALAEQLAAEADGVAALLDAGDPCGAAERAAALQQATIAALNRPAVPAALKEDLGAGVADLVDRAETECAAAQPPPVPPPATTAEEDGDEDENGDGRGKRGKGKGTGRGKKDE